MKQAIKRVLKRYGWELKRVPEEMDNERYSCQYIEDCSLTFTGRIDTGELAVSMCCEPIPDHPKITFSADPKETLARFIGLHALTVHEGCSGKGMFASGCKKCRDYQKRTWGTKDGLIHYVNLSMYPAPCQCHCVYCNVHREEENKIQYVNSNEVKEAYKSLFDMVRLAKEEGVIAPDARWQVSSGEITIHPFKEQIFELIQGENATFFTNCFQYDSKIANILHTHPGCALNLSIDAGTAQTWYKVKGVDNFEKVVSNLEAYHKCCQNPAQITLKYIVLPGINDSPEDYVSLMEIMQRLEVRHLFISRNMKEKYDGDRVKAGDLLDSVARLLAMCQTNHISYSLLSLGVDREVEQLAAEIVNRG